MAAELLVIGNPRKRKARRSRVRRNPARRKMSAKQAQYFGKRRTKRATRRRARHHSVALAANPARRRHARRRHVRRNPSFNLAGFKPATFVNRTLLPAGIGAGGALALDVALGYAAPHLPAFLTTGTVGPLATKIGGAVAIGMAAQAITKDRALAEQVTAGAIVVTLYGAAKKFLAAQFPTIPGLNGMGVYVHGMGYPGAARSFPDLGMYVPGGGATSLPPAVVSAIAQRAAMNKNQPPVGMHGGEMSEGGYSYA